MADLTQGAVDSLLGVLAKAIESETKLQKDVKGNIQFIKDEMDSMNGFLLHLNKSGNDHDDQQRAWMKQVREIAYDSQDCIELYNMYCTTPQRHGFWAAALFVPNCALRLRMRHRFSKKIQELRDRVKDVGERRERYGVTVPSAAAERRVRRDGGDKERQHFLSALPPLADEQRPSSLLPLFVSALWRWVVYPDAPFDKAISLLPADLAFHARNIHRGLLKHKAAAAAGTTTTTTDDTAAADVVWIMGMVLRALHAFRQAGPDVVGAGGMGELRKLTEAADDAAADLPKRALTFCYSELITEEKGCLQYLAAFNREKSISRTSLVRRCAAERLVSEDKEKEQTVEQRAEHCFDELLFRGFVSPGAVVGAAGKVKSCLINHGLVKEFIEDMCKQENFHGHGLPTHLQIQIKIRDAALPRDHGLAVAGRGRRRDDDAIDKMLRELKQLPSTYRLNVIDLGGCVGILNGSHLKRICKQAPTIKYLSLRNTDVDHLPHQLQELRLLETLDIRQTNIHGFRTKDVFPCSLKHLLAGNIDSDVTVRMPANAREMTNLEILSQVQVCRRKELRKIEYLPKLRKLGVVLVPGDEKAVKDLLRVICRLSGCLHSLSVRVRPPPINGRPTLEAPDDGTFSPLPSNLVSLRIDGMRSSGMPSWVERLKKLNKITLCDTLLTHEKLDALADLPALVCLRLRHRAYSGGELAFRKKPGGGGFPSLRFLRIEGVAVITELTFEEDSAPALETIAWSSANPATYDAAVVTAPVSLTRVDNLPKLKVVELIGLREQHPSALKQAMDKHPNHPRIIHHPYYAS